MDKTRQVQACIRCQRLSDQQDNYCTYCGAPLKNRCTNKGGLLGEPCNKLNHPRAVFCSACGAPTTFYKAGLLSTPFVENPQIYHDEEFEEIKDLAHFFFND